MEEFGQSSDVWNRKWKSSSQVRSLESGMEDFDPSSRLGIGNGGVRAHFRCLESGMKEFEQSSMLGIGNGRVRVNSDVWNREWKFEARNRECRSSSQVRCLQSEMEEIEPNSDP